MYAPIKHIFAKPKDPVMKEQRTDTIYSIPCNDCDNEYIGQTKCQFGTWLKEHQKAVFLCKKGNSALPYKPHIHYKYFIKKNFIHYNCNTSL